MHSPSPPTTHPADARLIQMLAAWVAEARGTEITAERCPGCGADARPYTGSPPHAKHCPWR